MAAIAVGGEQGWAEGELKELRRNEFMEAHAGSGILRAVTAAMAATAVSSLVRG